MNHTSRTLCIAVLLLSALIVRAQDDVSTGPETKSQPNKVYLRGVTAAAASDATSVRITGVAIAPDNSIRLQVHLFDATGARIPYTPAGSGFSLDVGCRNTPLTRIPAASATDVQDNGGQTGSNVVVLIDNSMLSGTFARDAVRSVRDVLPAAGTSDTVSVVTYSHAVDVRCAPTPLGQLSDALDPYAVGEGSGLSALYSAMSVALSTLGKRSTASHLIAVVASDDNASIGLATSNIVQRAKESGVQITIIRVGKLAQAYPLRSLALATHGIVYSVDDSEAGNVGHIVREILLGSHQHTRVDFASAPLSTVGCDDVWLRLHYSGADSTRFVVDSVLVPIADRSYTTNPAIVAVFDDTTEVGLQQYYPVLATMAEYLMTDSTVRVDLTGHVSADIRTDAEGRGLERASFVQGFLVAYGVKKKQIRIRSEGSSRPLYYLQLDGNQRLLNNRVEGFLVAPGEQPYTIMVDQVATEEQAIKQTATWEQRGYKAYFEPVVINKAPAYRVKLWGYTSSADVQKAVASIRKFNPRSAIVE